ncbi:MAG: hypothetical protein Q9170_002932 [Blastenia crenularia]
MYDDLQIVSSASMAYAGLLQTRWIKKSNTKRRTYLKYLRPAMYESQNTHLDIHMTKTCDAMSTRQYHDAFLLPYLTIETLSVDSSRLLRLLHHRVAHTPEAWVSFDNRQILAGWLAGIFEEKFNAGSIVMFGKAYGKWTKFDRSAVHNGDSYGTPRALLILEAQATLARFLRDFTTAMLADIDELTIEETSHRLATMSIHQNAPPQLEQPSWAQFSMSYYNEPFTAPPVFNLRTISQLIEIVSEKQAETQDHLWLLQTDPAYFQMFAQYWNQYNLGTIAGSKMTKDAKLNALETRVMHYSVTQAQSWNHLLEELQIVRKEYLVHHKNIRCGHPLPASYDQALSSLQLLVINYLIGKSTHVYELAFVSPAWRSMYVVDPQIGDGRTAVRRKDGGVFNPRETYKSDHIRFCLMHLGEKPESKGSTDIAVLLKSLDLYLANCSRTEAAKIDAITYSHLTDMAAMYRVLATLRMHRPAHSLEYTQIEFIKKTRDSQAWRLLSHNQEWQKIVQDPRQFRFGSALENLNKYRMPTGKKTQQWLESADHARAALSELWCMARNNFRQLYQKLGINAKDTEDVVRMLSYHDSPDHVAAIGQEREVILANIAKSAQPRVTSEQQFQSFIPHVSTAEDLSVKGAGAAKASKLKPKMRAKDNVAVSETLNELKPGGTSSQNPSSPVHILPLPKKAKSLDTLRLLFPTATSDFHGTIHWADFITAMAELSFQGEHRGGSEWTFRSPSTSDAIDSGEGPVLGKRSIVIHQPHPENRLGSLSLQWIGKRLARRFGWERGSFDGL